MKYLKAIKKSLLKFLITHKKEIKEILVNVISDLIFYIIIKLIQ